MRIVPRGELGLAAPRNRSMFGGPATWLFVHHTVTSPKGTDGEEARNVQQIAFGRGFADISYSFLVSSRGTPLEGRGALVVGAHTVTKAGARQLRQYGKKNWNGSSHAVSLVGNSDHAAVPSDAQVEAFRWVRHHLIETGVQLAPTAPWQPWSLGVAPQVGWYTPHQEVNATACPGSGLVQRLGDLNTPIVSGETPPGPPPTELVDIHALADVVNAFSPAADIALYQRWLQDRADRTGLAVFSPGPADGAWRHETTLAGQAWRRYVALDPWNGSWDSLVKEHTIRVWRGEIVPVDPTAPPPPPPPPPVPVGTPILEATSATREQAQAWALAKSAAPVFALIVDALYGAPNEAGVNVAGAVAQAAIETGYGHFGGAVTAEWHNTAGIKATGATGDRPQDHHRFPSWAHGADAHLVHLALYAGVDSPNGAARDPRYGTWVKGKSTTWEGLTGVWAAGGGDYGGNIVRLLAEINATEAPPPPDPPVPPGPPAPIAEIEVFLSDFAPHVDRLAAEWDDAVRRLRERLSE